MVRNAWILFGALPLFAQSTLPVLSYTLGPPVTFATHAQLAGYGFLWGPSDGSFGAIPAATSNTYTFYGTADSASSCKGTASGTAGAYTFTGTLDQISGSACKNLFTIGAGPAGWVFDRDYAGGGQVVEFSSGGKSGYLMPVHGEYHWQNPQTSNHECAVSGGATVPCFYSGIGLAVSTDGGNTFQVVGQIMQPSEPLSVFTGGGQNMPVGYGSLIVADVNGNHLPNPPPDPTAALPLQRLLRRSHMQISLLATVLRSVTQAGRTGESTGISAIGWLTI
jgi:hypothetical protein